MGCGRRNTDGRRGGRHSQCLLQDTKFKRLGRRPDDRLTSSRFACGTGAYVKSESVVESSFFKKCHEKSRNSATSGTREVARALALFQRLDFLTLMALSGREIQY